MAEVDRELWRSSCPVLVSSQVHLQQVSPDHVESGFEYVGGTMTCSSAWSPSHQRFFFLLKWKIFLQTYWVRLGKTSKTIKSNLWLIMTLSTRPEDWVPCPVISWTCPGIMVPPFCRQSIPMLNHHFCEGILPDVHPEAPPAQPEGSWFFLNFLSVYSN